MITEKIYDHDVIANGIFYRAGESVKINIPDAKETPIKKNTSGKKDTSSAK